MRTPLKSSRVLQSNAMSFDPSTTITIRVGPAASCKTFLVHESFLTARSEFFRRAMNGNWTESETRTIDLVEDDPDTFALYLNHVYKNHLPIAVGPEELGALNTEQLVAHLCQEYTSLFKLYVLAERLQDTAAKDEVLTVVFQVATIFSDGRSCCPPPQPVIDLVYNGTPKGSPARQLLADLWSSTPVDILEKLSSRSPQVFLNDLVLTLRRELPSIGMQNVAKAKGIKAYLEATRSSEKTTASPEKTSSPIN